MIVTGKLSSGTGSLLSILQDKVEPSIIAHGQDRGPRPSGWKRPFVETASANRERIKEVIKETVEFPERDESQGELLITYNGPSPTAFLERKVCLMSPTLCSSRNRFLGSGHLIYLPHIIARGSPEQRVR